MFYLYGLKLSMNCREDMQKLLDNIVYPGTFNSYCSSATDHETFFWGHCLYDDDTVFDPNCFEIIQEGLFDFPHIRNDIVSFVDSVAQIYGLAQGTCYKGRGSAPSQR